MCEVSCNCRVKPGEPSREFRGGGRTKHPQPGPASPPQLPPRHHPGTHGPTRLGPLALPTHHRGRGCLPAPASACPPPRSPGWPREDGRPPPPSGRRGYRRLGGGGGGRAGGALTAPPQGRSTPAGRCAPHPGTRGWRQSWPGQGSQVETSCYVLFWPRLAPSLTTWSGPGTRRSSRAAQRNRSGGGRAWPVRAGGARSSAGAPGPPATLPYAPASPQLPSFPTLRVLPSTRGGPGGIQSMCHFLITHECPSLAGWQGPHLAECLQQKVKLSDGLGSSLRPPGQAVPTALTCSGGRRPHQRLRLEILHDRVLADRQVVLVATEEQAVVHGVAHQVDAGAHDEGDDADVDHGARQGAGGPLDELRSEGGLAA